MSRLSLVKCDPLVIQLLLLHLHQVAAPVQAKLYHILQQLSVLLLGAKSHMRGQVKSLGYVKTLHTEEGEGEEEEIPLDFHHYNHLNISKLNLHLTLMHFIVSEIEE